MRRMPQPAPSLPQVARLAALAQHSTEEVMAAREAAQAERSRAEALAHDKAELQGRVSTAGLVAVCVCGVQNGLWSSHVKAAACRSDGTDGLSITILD